MRRRPPSSPSSSSVESRALLRSWRHRHEPPRRALIRAEILLRHALHIGGRDQLDFLRKGYVQRPIADADPFAELAGHRCRAVALVRILGNELLLDAGNLSRGHAAGLDLVKSRQQRAFALLVGGSRSHRRKQRGPPQVAVNIRPATRTQGHPFVVTRKIKTRVPPRI